MNNQQKLFSKYTLLIIFLVALVSIVGYVVLTQNPISQEQENVQTPAQQKVQEQIAQEDVETPAETNIQDQAAKWVEYRWNNVLKFKYPSNWKIEVGSTSITLTPPSRTSSFIIPQVQAASNDSITIGGQKSCLTLGTEYNCKIAFGVPIYTASNDSGIIDVFEKVYDSTTLIISSRDAETGIAVKASYIVNGKEYTEDELNSYLKTAPPGTYSIIVKADGYKTAMSYFVLPVTQVSSARFMLDPLTQPPELSNDYLQQFTKQGTGLLIGYVVDEDGQPLEGVIVKSPAYSATTNSRGFYALNVTISPSESCAGVDITFTKSGYKTKKYLHAMSGNIVPTPVGEGYVRPTTDLWDVWMNIALSKGSGEDIIDNKHKLCP
jgi:hypothetical protein